MIYSDSSFTDPVINNDITIKNCTITINDIFLNGCTTLLSNLLFQDMDNITIINGKFYNLNTTFLQGGLLFSNNSKELLIDECQFSNISSHS
jgi:hypothetical protein